MRLAWVFPVVAVLGGCSVDNPGVAPEAEQINFPIAIALRPGDRPSHLFLANSNFDLRYNAGSVQSFDLEAVGAALEGCSAGAPCELDDVGLLLTDEVFIGSHAAGMDISPDGDRLYLAVRSDTNLTYVDVGAGGTLECGQQGNPGRCSEDFRRGNEAIASERGIALPGDPVGIVATELRDLGYDAEGDAILMAHRSGRVSLFLEQTEGPAVAPALVHVVSGLPEGLVNLSLDRNGFAWAPSANVAQLGRVGVAIDAETSDLMDSFVFDLGSLALNGIDIGRGGGDTRDVAFDPRPDVDRAYVLSRRPEAVLIADRTNASPGDVGVVDVVPIGIGPSRLAIAELDLAADGSPPDLRTLLFASCFDTREVWIVDADFGEAVNIVRGLSGPFELAVDVARRYLYIVDFRASVVRVADLRPMLDCLARGVGSPAAPETCEPSIIGWIGKERPVGELL